MAQNGRKNSAFIHRAGAGSGATWPSPPHPAVGREGPSPAQQCERRSSYIPSRTEPTGMSCTPRNLGPQCWPSALLKGFPEGKGQSSVIICEDTKDTVGYYVTRPLTASWGHVLVPVVVMKCHWEALTES